jgi:hypothetical protein
MEQVAAAVCYFIEAMGSLVKNNTNVQPVYQLPMALYTTPRAGTFSTCEP